MATPGNDSNVIPRDCRVGIAIEMSVDKIFLSMYCKRSMFSRKSVEHILNTILAIRPRVAQILKGVELNSTEESVLNKLDSLAHSILYNDVSTREFFSIETISYLLERIDSRYVSSYNIQSLLKSIFFVLSVANQIDYSDSTVVIPYLRMLPKDHFYVKSFTRYDVTFNLSRSDNGNSTDMWYRIYQGLHFNILNSDPYPVLRNICTTINIGTNPDFATGLGITKFTYESIVASELTRRFVESNGYLSNGDDCGRIQRIIVANNPWLSKTSFLNKEVECSLEAKASVPKEDDSSDNKTEDSTNTNASTSKLDKDGESSKNNVQADVTDPNKTDNTPPEDDGSTPDKSETEGSSDNLDQEDDNKRRPCLMGLNLVLPENETLDDFMYKMSVARFIDNVIEFNHDDLPLEAVSTLTQWKSALLFLTDAKETARLLRDLKITL